MSYPKVGTYRRSVNILKEKYNLTPLDFDVLIYIAENGVCSKYDLKNNVSNSGSSIQISLQYLEKKKYLKNVRPFRSGIRGFPTGYSVTGIGRRIVTEFYMTLFPDIIN